MADIKKYFKEKDKFEHLDGSQSYIDWPKPINKYILTYEAYNQSLEEVYFWVLHHLRYGLQISEFDKITDAFAAGLNSAFGGGSQQRLGINQDRISNYLGTIGKLTKELFQIVREIRIIDERLDLYNASMKKKSHAAEITLKGYWVDMVEGGGKNPASVYGMASQIGFVTLPDVFFGAPANLDPDKVDDYVNKLEYNRKLREVLARKLKAYHTWKKHTFKELSSRRRFTIKYLRQHYNAIKLYMDWVKPYLRNVKRLTMDQTKFEKQPELTATFDSALTELEVLAKAKAGNYYSVILVNFFFKTKPEMSYVNEGYNRGPHHNGSLQITFRSYAWTQEDIDNYKKFRREEEFELIGEVDESLKEAIAHLGDEFINYLEEAGEKDIMGTKREEKKEGKKPKRESILDPFVSLFKGVGELGGAFVGHTPGEKEKPTGTCGFCGAQNPIKSFLCKSCEHPLRSPTKQEAFDLENSKKKAIKTVNKKMWTVYKNTKKMKRMLAWS